jgi:hypothetical protein
MCNYDTFYRERLDRYLLLDIIKSNTRIAGPMVDDLLCRGGTIYPLTRSGLEERTFDWSWKANRVDATHKVTVAQRLGNIGQNAGHYAHGEHNVVGVGQLHIE